MKQSGILDSRLFAQVPDVPVGGGALSASDFFVWSERIAEFLIGVAPIIAVIVILWGGITYMAAGSSEEKASRAKRRLINGFIGAVVIFGVGVILQTARGFLSGEFFR